MPDSLLTYMTNLPCFAVTILATFTLLTTSEAQSDAKTPVTPAVTAEIMTAEQSTIAVLEKEIEVFKEFTGDILSTVYFSLGTVIVVLFAMIGFGWYQNFRSYEKDKEALRAHLEAILNEMVSVTEEKLSATAKDRFSQFDSSIAKALTNVHQRLSDVHLSADTEVFRATYSQKTPETDLMVLLDVVKKAIGRVSPGCLNHSLSVICDHIETGGRINSRPQWLELIDRLPPESIGYSTRLRELLADRG